MFLYLYLDLFVLPARIVRSLNESSLRVRLSENRDTEKSQQTHEITGTKVQSDGKKPERIGDRRGADE